MPKAPPPITIRLNSKQGQVIELPRLVSMLQAQLLFLPQNAAGCPVFEHVLRRHWSLDANGDQDAIWNDTGDLRTAVMTGIDLRPLSDIAIAKINTKSTKAKSHTSKIFFLTQQWPGYGCSVEEDIQIVKQKFEDLKAEVECEYVGSELETALHDVAKAQIGWLVSARLKRFLTKDVAAGLLKQRRKDEREFVVLADLVSWAKHRGIIIEKEEPALTTLTNLTGAGERCDSQAYDATSIVQPWQKRDPRDPEPKTGQPWQTAAWFFARQEIRNDPTLVGATLDTIAGRVQPLLPKVGYYKRNKVGAEISTATIKKALSGIQLW